MRSRLFVFVSIVQAILLLAHWFVYATVAYFWGGFATSWTVKLALILLSVSFVAASLRGWYSYQPLVRFFYTAAAVWLGFASFFLLASVGSWIADGLSVLAGLGWRPAWIADIAFAAGHQDAHAGRCPPSGMAMSAGMTVLCRAPLHRPCCRS